MGLIDRSVCQVGLTRSSVVYMAYSWSRAHRRTARDAEASMNNLITPFRSSFS